jgi:hypothetical protein
LTPKLFWLEKLLPVCKLPFEILLERVELDEFEPLNHHEKKKEGGGYFT